MIRGIDESHIESMGEAADPIIVRTTDAAFIQKNDNTSYRQNLKRNK